MDTVTQYGLLCPHLRPHVSLDGVSAPRAVDAWTTFGWVVLVESEPFSAARYTPPLEARLSDVRTSGWTNAYFCPIDAQHVAWGTGARPLVSPTFRGALERSGVSPPGMADALRGERPSPLGLRLLLLTLVGVPLLVLLVALVLTFLS